MAEFLRCKESAAGGWRVDVPAHFAVLFEAGQGWYLRLTAAQHGTDGFFAAVLKKDEES